MRPSEATKAIGVAITGSLAWGYQVVASAPRAITAAEWLGLLGVGAASAACFGLGNADPAPKPQPPASVSITTTPPA